MIVQPSVRGSQRATRPEAKMMPTRSTKLAQAGNAFIYFVGSAMSMRISLDPSSSPSFFSRLATHRGPNLEKVTGECPRRFLEVVDGFGGGRSWAILVEPSRYEERDRRDVAVLEAPRQQVVVECLGAAFVMGGEHDG
jgi:hypothetical protein